MNIEAFRTYCLSKPKATEHFPFDESTLVFKVANKMFALTGLERRPFQVNLKCDPERATILREQFDGVILPGYHMSKKHWNTIILEGAIADDFLKELIDHSYDLIIQSLPKKVRLTFEE